MTACKVTVTVTKTACKITVTETHNHIINARKKLWSSSKSKRNSHKTNVVLQLEDATQPEGSVLNRSLYTTTLEGDWESADRVIKQNGKVLTAEISMLSMTALHVAAFSGHSKFVEKLIEQMTPEEVDVKDLSGNTALLHAATTGNLNVAIALLRKNCGLTEVQGNQGFLPLLTAVVYGADKGKEMAWFLAMRTENPLEKLELLQEDKSGRNILSILAVRPTDFQSGTKLNCWETWIYKLAPFKQLSSVRGDVEDPPEKSDDLFSRTRSAKVCKWSREQTWNVVMAIAPSTSKRLQDAKMRHKYALELVTFVCDRAKPMSNRKFVKFFLEIVKICLQHFPDLIWLRKSWKTVLHVAIEHRRELIFNLIYKRSALFTVHAYTVLFTRHTALLTSLLTSLFPFPLPNHHLAKFELRNVSQLEKIPHCSQHLPFERSL
ncbi:hypothetical protein ACOSQ3_020441 [Xanthoceras sorbifolium]